MHELGVSDLAGRERLAIVLLHPRFQLGKLSHVCFAIFRKHAPGSHSSQLARVLELIDAAKIHGLKLAIASSSPHSWVDNHAKRLGIFHYFDKVICADDMGVGRTKPNPDLFLLALNQLEVEREAAVVFEDSPNGVTAANHAGIFVVAVPNHVTAQLKLEHANLVMKSLADLSLYELMERMK